MLDLMIWEINTALVNVLPQEKSDSGIQPPKWERLNKLQLAIQECINAGDFPKPVHFPDM